MTASATRLQKYSVSIRGHATSYTLEGAFYEIIEAIARERGISISALIAEIDGARAPHSNLSSALRLSVLEWLKQRALLL